MTRGQKRNMVARRRGSHVMTAMEPAAMRDEEYARLERLLREVRPKNTLEVGMANGSSTEVICRYLKESGGGVHVSVDPFQTKPEGWGGRGLERVEKAGLSAFHSLIEDYDYLALPRLLSEGGRFDLILIDGWHSFDYTLIDFFYADLLLKPQGVLVFHDTGMASVHKVCRFIETHKRYVRLSPAPAVLLRPFWRRIGRRLGQMLGGPGAMAEARSRRSEWFSLAAYRKLEEGIVPSDFYAPF